MSILLNRPKRDMFAGAGAFSKKFFDALRRPRATRSTGTLSRLVDPSLPPRMTDRELAKLRSQPFIEIMFGVTTSDDYRPVAWIGRYPVRVTSIICGLFVLGMFVTSICRTADWDYTVLAFQPYQFLHGRLWQLFTAPLIQQPDFFFLFNVLFFYWSGNQVEQYLGVRRYLILIALLIVVPPLLLVPWGQVALVTPWYGSRELTIGMFIAFATLYPNMEVFGWVTLKWLAFAGLLISSMEALARHYWPPLLVLWGMSLISFGFILQVQGRIPSTNLPTINPFRRKPKFQVVPKPRPRRPVEPDDFSESVDAILDKISKSGMTSLTESERNQLERARNRLLKNPE